MKNPLNPLNQDKIIIDGLGLENLSVKPLNPLNRDPLNQDSLCIIIFDTVFQMCNKLC